jgi:hypothetical protein
MKKMNILLNKPIFTGTTVLDLSKKTMYNFHYNHIKQIYGSSAVLLYTDTDSFIYLITTDDVYKDMFKNKYYYDMSSYESTDPQFGKFYDDTNKKVLGKFKDEFAGKVIASFRGPRPKMYALRILEPVLNSNGSYEISTNGKIQMQECIQKKIKGITKLAVSNQVNFRKFLYAITKYSITNVEMKGIRSKKHQLTTQVIWKRALHGLDTKRFAADNVNTLAFGHKNIQILLENE